MKQSNLSIIGSTDSGALNPEDEDAGLDHSALDRQHELLTESFRRFADLVHHREERTEAINYLRGLIMKVGLHFGFEESLMAKSGYPDFTHHLQQHVGMMTELGLVLDRLENNADSGVVRQIDLLIDWYQRHVSVSDYKFVIWMAG